LLLSAVLRPYDVALLILGARHTPLMISISCPYGAQQQTRRTPHLQSNDGTDRWMDARPFYRACSAYSIMQLVQYTHQQLAA